MHQISDRKIEEIVFKSSVGIPLDKIAKDGGLGRMTVRRYAVHDPRFDQETVKVKRYLAQIIESNLLRVASHITDLKLSKSSAAQLLMGIAVLTDKWTKLTEDQNKPLVALQIVGLSQEQMQSLVVKELPGKTKQATPQDIDP